MSQDAILSVFKEALFLAFKLAGPLLIVSLLVGLVISILQAATQVHEQTLTFVPKLIAVALVLFILGSWMIDVSKDFMERLFEIIAGI